MINPTEQEERAYLEQIIEKLLRAIQYVEETVKQFAADLKRNKEYMYEHQSGMDDADHVAAGQSIDRMVFTGQTVAGRKRRLQKLMDSPYFGRIDFTPGDKKAKAVPVYIGIHSFADEINRMNLIYDWRAPISSMFYDFELGEAWYTTPSGKVEGTIELKRQYKIRQARMEFMIENALSIHDEILQKELSKTSDDRMKNIVATIQRDQNAVIRNETAPVMIIQGVAGSGKTSIALHRIAFLLYRFRETITAKDILIISPNKVFADYISNVLPELGEENIPEMGMEELAGNLLESKFRFQNFFQQVAHLLEGHDAALIERIRFKSSLELVSKLNQYFVHVENNYFEPKPIRVGAMTVQEGYLRERFKVYHRMPLLSRFPDVVNDILVHVRTALKRKLTGKEKSQVWEAVPRMFRMSNLYDLYKGFYTWMGKEELLKMLPGSMLEYSDVFPLIYCKIRLEGVQAHDHVKHLLVDEMQDYTPVQYTVLSRLFRCKKTILGDVRQGIHPYSASAVDAIRHVFPQADTVELFRSYRSTFEITAFAQQILPDPRLIAMERHGQVPDVKGFKNHSEEVEEIRSLIAAFNTSGYHSLGILCKTLTEAKALNHELKVAGVHLLTPESTSFSDGVVITTIPMAKGLEFDEVIVPFVTAENYDKEMDKSLLYIACTRAMHRLTLTFSGKRASF